MTDILKPGQSGWFIAVIVSLFTIGIIFGAYIGTHDERQRAVKAGVGRWYANEYGHVHFEYNK